MSYKNSLRWRFGVTHFVKTCTSELSVFGVRGNSPSEGDHEKMAEMLKVVRFLCRTMKEVAGNIAYDGLGVTKIAYDGAYELHIWQKSVPRNFGSFWGRDNSPSEEVHEKMAEILKLVRFLSRTTKEVAGKIAYIGLGVTKIAYDGAYELHIWQKSLSQNFISFWDRSNSPSEGHEKMTEMLEFRI